jgi:hypothetical protein
VTDIRGRPLDFSRGRGLAVNSGVVATNGLLHGSSTALARRRFVRSFVLLFEMSSRFA